MIEYENGADANGAAYGNRTAGENNASWMHGRRPRRGCELSRAAAVAAFIVLGAAWALAPRRIVLAQRLEFEVASVKANTTNGPSDFTPRRSGDRVTMHNMQLYSVIYYAYHLKGSYQMTGDVRLPDGWNWYDIEAKAGFDATDDQIRLMFQSLLADRFRLKVHRETRENTEYELVVYKGRPKLTPSAGRPMSVTIENRRMSPREGVCGISAWLEGLHLVCHAAAMEAIAAAVGGQLSAPVVDQTGLKGTYDVNLLFASENRKVEADVDPAPPLAEALQQELGLRLEKGKGPVEVLVIDHIEKPSQN